MLGAGLYMVVLLDEKLACLAQLADKGQAATHDIASSERLALAMDNDLATVDLHRVVANHLEWGPALVRGTSLRRI